MSEPQMHLKDDLLRHPCSVQVRFRWCPLMVLPNEMRLCTLRAQLDRVWIDSSISTTVLCNACAVEAKSVLISI